MGRRRGVGSWAVLLATVAVLGCGGTDEPQPGGPVGPSSNDGGTGCRLASDCSDGSACVNGACSDATRGTRCSSDSECGTLECEDGFCKPHGGDRDDDDDDRGRGRGGDGDDDSDDANDDAGGTSGRG